MIVAIVRIYNKWEMHKFRDAKKLLEWFDEYRHLPGDFYTINCTKPTLPDEGELKRAQSLKKLWCPWCAEPRKFEYIPTKHLSRCPVCHASEKEKYVKKINKGES